METLVAMSTITGDAEDVIFPDVAIFITTQPVSDSGVAANNEVVTFSVVAETVPAGETVAYQWQADTGTGFANVADGAIYSGSTTDRTRSKCQIQQLTQTSELFSRQITQQM
jgi:hypothetical protein